MRNDKLEQQPPFPPKTKSNQKEEEIYIKHPRRILAALIVK
jgi:hypothetical protein